MSVFLPESVEQAREFLHKHARRDLVAWDTETTGLQVRNGVDKPRIVQFSWRPWDNALVLPVTPEYARLINQVFEIAHETVGHNVKFDIHAMANAGISVWEWFDSEDVHDTMWSARLYDERTSAKLKDLATRYLRDDASAEQTKLKRLMKSNGWTWETVPVKYLVEYGGQDAILTGQLFDFLYPQIAYSSEAYKREQRLHPVLYKMERRGLTVDRALLVETTETYRTRVGELGDKLEALAPKLNPRSPVQLKGALRKRGLELPDTTGPTLLRHREDELVATLLEYREAHKTLSTYLEPWSELIRPTGRLHPWFNQLGAATGRFSSSDPNLQNITRGHKLRDVFSAEPGSKIVVADWNQMELRLYAHYAEDENMRAAFLSGDDIYQQVADLLGVPRQIGKMIMLASIYGAGPAALKNQCINMSLKFGDFELIPILEEYDWGELYERYHQEYRIKELSRKCELVARRREMVDEPYIVTWGGRRQRPKIVLSKYEVNGRRKEITIYKDLSNSLVQGSSADMMKQALIDVDGSGLGEYLRLTVHDEMVLEVPDNEIEEVKNIVSDAMTHNEFIPPLTAAVSVADRYGEAK